MTDRLRTILRIDSALCVAIGIAAAIGADQLADHLGIEPAAVVRFVGIALLPYASVLAFVSTRCEIRVRQAGRVTAIADAGWVLGTLAVLATGTVTGGGTVTLLVAAAAVATLGVTKTMTIGRSAVATA